METKTELLNTLTANLKLLSVHLFQISIFYIFQLIDEEQISLYEMPSPGNSFFNLYIDQVSTLIHSFVTGKPEFYCMQRIETVHFCNLELCF